MKRTDGDNHGCRHHHSTRMRLDRSSTCWQSRITGHDDAKEKTQASAFAICRARSKTTRGNPAERRSKRSKSSDNGAFGAKFASPVGNAVIPPIQQQTMHLREIAPAPPGGLERSAALPTVNRPRAAKARGRNFWRSAGAAIAAPIGSSLRSLRIGLAACNIGRRFDRFRNRLGRSQQHREPIGRDQ
ncbi:hypothetical protein V1278_002541 [Bradyrhizobium sp. AZCC 1577]